MKASRFNRSPEAEHYRKLYKTKRWQLIRRQQLTSNPLCALCQEEKKLTPATIVHHIEAHKGNEVLFYDLDNLQSLCASHHNSDKQSEERVGYNKKVGVDGWPTDKKHPFNKRDSLEMTGCTLQRLKRNAVPNSDCDHQQTPQRK